MTGTAPLEAGIIAAGDGARLKASHPALVKPLVPVAGTPLCHWVVGSLRRAGVQNLTVLHNSRGRAIRESLTGSFPDLSWFFLEEDTASSWESFRLVSRTMAARAEGFLISTADALIAPEEAARFAREVRARGARAGLALTSFVDDEKPLWADLGPDGLVSALGDRAVQRAHVTCGLYYMTKTLALEMPPAAAHGSLRSYWGSLAQAGVPIAGVALSKTIDVDRPEDIAQAEGFLKATTTW